LKQSQADLVAAKSRKYKSFRMGYGGGRATTIMIPDEGVEIQCPLCQKRFLTLDGSDANTMRVCEQYEVNLLE
jgi:uncharacterized Fe-S cluster-containing radical SAM superfamily protein